MKVISIWQPFASLLVHGHKVVETRSWPAPKSIIGETIGIASTKNVTPIQRRIMNDPEFRFYYDECGLPELEELPHGCVLGTVTIHSCDVMTEEDLDDISESERLFGEWEVGRYAWRVRNSLAFPKPYPAKGAQGLWNWDPFVAFTDQARSENPDWPANSGRHLRVVQ